MMTTPMLLNQIVVDWRDFLPQHPQKGSRELLQIYNVHERNTFRFNAGGEAVRGIGYSNFLKGLACPDALYLVAVHNMANEDSAEAVQFIDMIENCGLAVPSNYKRLSDYVHAGIGWVDKKPHFGSDLIIEIVDKLKQHSNLNETLINVNSLTTFLGMAGVGIERRGNRYFYNFPYGFHHSPSKVTSFIGSIEIRVLISILESYLEAVTTDGKNDVYPFRNYGKLECAFALLEAYLFIYFVDGAFLDEDFGSIVGELIHDLVEAASETRKGQEALVEHIIEIDNTILGLTQNAKAYTKIQPSTKELVQSYWEYMTRKDINKTQ